VWDGLVTMVVGNGMMIEARDQLANTMTAVALDAHARRALCRPSPAARRSVGRVNSEMSFDEIGVLLQNPRKG
jgi:hypothetical protein